MSSKRNKMGWWANLPAPEAQKDHENIPDSLGIGRYENRDANGQLVIYFGNHSNPMAVLGKYREPLRDGSIFYVSHRKNWAAPPDVNKFDHLIPAIAHIVLLKEKYDEISDRTAR